jgi:hypothetical protein
MGLESRDIPSDMEKVHERFERWRSAHTGRLPIPQRLWTAAVKLARKHGVFETAKALHLEYGKLKRLTESESVRGAARSARKSRRAQATAPTPAFLELVGSSAIGLSECVIELEGSPGKIRIQWKGTTAPDLAGLSRALWERT